ncbi:MAG: DUF4340 domain-containing protein, partial [Alphaproteobacteria bacterium]|nr:DUF4340 domain-containing protein [Alphaproteobacteria bacterium]
MNRATLIGIGAAALVAVGAAVMVGRDDAATAPAKPLPLYPGLIERLNDVVELRIEAKTGSLVIAQAEGDAWIMPEKGGYPAKFDAVKKALLGVAEIKTIEAKTAKPELYSKIAVEDRSAKDSGATLVTLKGKDGKPAAELLIGKADRVATDTKPGSYYARKAGDPQSWLVSGSLAIEPTLNRWVESKLFEIPRKRVTSAVIKRGDGDGVAVVKRAGSEDDFDLTTPLPAGRKLIAPTTPGVVAAALDYLPFDDVAKA